MRSLVAAVALLAATAPAAAGTAPARGALYTGSAAGIGSVSFTVSKDGKRVSNIVGRDVTLRCPGKSTDPIVSSFDGLAYPESTAVRRGGTFRAKLEDDFGPTVVFTGRFGANRSVSGIVRVVDGTKCTAKRRYTASVAASKGGTARRVFSLPSGGTDAFDLPGGAIGLQEVQTDIRVVNYSFNRLDVNGRDKPITDLGGDAATEVVGLGDGSVVYSDVGCIALRSAAGKTRTLAGDCDTSPPVLRPTYFTPIGGGSYVFSDGDGAEFGKDDTRLQRLGPDGKITPLAPLNGVTGGMATERDGSVLVSSQNRVLRVSPAGVVTVAAGTGSPRFSGDGGPATAAGMAPASVVVLPSGGFVFVDDSVNRLRQVSPSGVVTTFAGAGEAGTGSPGRTFATPSISSLDQLRDGSIVFGDGRGMEIMPGPKSKRLLVGLPETPARYGALVRARRSLPVVLTRRAKVKLVVTRGKRRVVSLARTLPAGTTRVRVPARARTRGKGRLSLVVSARAGAARGGDSLTLR